MSKRTDIHTILIIGAGPIVIGQACEFDYSGVQACNALRSEGYRVVLVNSNPATIMTDPETADATYIEPITWQTVARIIEVERPKVKGGFAILPTMGGQTALNCALDLYRQGILEKFDCELIGAKPASIEMAEDRQLFKLAMARIGLNSARSSMAHSLTEASQVQQDIGFPVIIRPSFTLGGTGGGIAYNEEEFITICKRGLDASPNKELLIEESLIGWKEIEMEVVRDHKDNCIIVCGIENFDPMGIHTGDSITVAPIQTLTDKEYQHLRDASIAVLREIGVDTGGSNVQFAINPKDGRVIVIEMNPRVSRSSALASKATGFPIAKIAAKLAVGYTLDELSNDITGGATPASFEPSIDYVVVKIPRFAFEKFKDADDRLTTQMKSVGEVMAMGRNFTEAMQKAMRGLEIGVDGFNEQTQDIEVIRGALAEPRPDRIWFIGDAFAKGLSLDEVHRLTNIDKWFLAQIEFLIATELKLEQTSLTRLSKNDWRELKRHGFSDRRIAHLLKTKEDQVRQTRHSHNVRPVYKRVDTCAAEFDTSTAYLYSSYDEECEARPSKHKKIMILGGGPNRIGQGIEFDYCCVHAAFALRDLGFETIMVNCNPETVSTDYDTSDRLYFEPLTLEDVLEIIAVEQPQGVIVQFGGQTPLKLALALEANGVPIIGTSPKMIDAAEDREQFQKLVQRLNLLQPPNRTARTIAQAITHATEIGYPLVVRPSYVLGGRAMEIIHEEAELHRYMREAVQVSHDAPVLLDRFLNDAIECDVDCVSDGAEVYIGGVMEHIEQAGVHSGDSACSLPVHSLSPSTVDLIKQHTRTLARALNVIGLMNVQFAIQQKDGVDTVYLLEVNPRAARTVPFVSKAIGIPLAKIAAACMVGKTLKEQGVITEITPSYFSVKEAVFPFVKFPGVDTLLGPEMKSTGEVMGIGKTFGEAFVKSQIAAGARLPLPANSKVFISVKNSDKPQVVDIARDLLRFGFRLAATRGTAAVISAAGLTVEVVNKVTESRPHIVDLIKNQEIALVINTVEERRNAIADSRSIRTSALTARLETHTTLAGARAMIEGMRYLDNMSVNTVQDLHRQLN